MIRVTTHPGVILKNDFMRPLGLSKRALAAEINVPARAVAALIRGTQAMTADMAIRLGEQFGTSAEVWMNLQISHELSVARRARLRPEAADKRPIPEP